MRGKKFHLSNNQIPLWQSDSFDALHLKAERRKRFAN
jgi:hypothetical protein